MKAGDLVLKQVVAPTRIGKLLPSWEGPYQVKEKLQHGTYKLEELDGTPVPERGTWPTYAIITVRIRISLFCFFIIAKHGEIATPDYFTTFSQYLIKG